MKKYFFHTYIPLFFLLLFNFLELYSFSYFFLVWGLMSYIWGFFHFYKDYINRKNIKTYVFSKSFIYIFYVIFLSAGAYEIATSLGESIVSSDYINYEIYVASSFFDFFYYSVITASTLGFGDFAPSQGSVMIKIITMFEVMFGPLIILCFISASLSMSDNEPPKDNLSDIRHQFTD